MISIATTNSSYAQCLDVIRDCKNALQLGEKALDDKQKALDLANTALNQSIRDKDMLAIELADKEKELNKWNRKPVVLIGGGAVGGALLTKGDTAAGLGVLLGTYLLSLF